MQSGFFFNLAALVCLASLPAAAGAQSHRCGNDLANVGDSKASVFDKCGEPYFKDTFCKDGPSYACERVDEWTYKPGYGQFLTTLRFERGQLVSIRYGERIK